MDKFLGRQDPGLDTYDPELIDDAPHEPLTIQARLAAERELAARDRQEWGESSPRSFLSYCPTPPPPRIPILQAVVRLA